MVCTVAGKHELHYPSAARDTLVGNLEPWTIQTNGMAGNHLADKAAEDKKAEADKVAYKLEGLLSRGCSCPSTRREG